MSTYKLYYFNVRGRAEIARLIFSAAGEQFEDIRYERNEWSSHKSEMPLGQMPVLEVDGVKLTQSMTIARFLAKQFGLAGKDNLEEDKVDVVVDTSIDLAVKLLPILYELDEGKKKIEMKNSSLTNCRNIYETSKFWGSYIAMNAHFLLGIILLGPI
jgi:glutathione S-transferase